MRELFRFSLARRVTWALTGTVTAFVVVLCLAAYAAFDQMEDALVNSILASEAQYLENKLAAGAALTGLLPPVGERGAMQAWLVSGPQNAQQLPADLRDLREGVHVLSLKGHTWHVLVKPVTQGMLFLRYDATTHEVRVGGFGLLVLGVGLACIFAAWLLAYKLARRVVEPLVELTDQLADWAPGLPDIAVRRDDEAGRLVEAFNRVQNRVEKSIAFEREFSANLSHEIRTLLAAIRSDCEMALLEADPDVDSTRRLQRVMVNVDAVADSLLGATVLDRPDQTRMESVPLHQSLDKAWLALSSEAQRRGLVLINDIPVQAQALLDPYAVLIVMRNLVRNAIEHAAPATLTVWWEAPHRLIFSDNGPGIPPDRLLFVFDRYYSSRNDTLEGASGSAMSSDGPPAARRGLGLAIARRVCDLQGWALSVQSGCQEPRTGATFILEF